MAQPLSQLLVPLTVDQWRTLLLSALQGLGVVIESGSGAGGVALGSGAIALSGSPSAALPKVIIKIVTSGELGVAQFQVSTDGGTTFGGTNTVAANGVFALTSVVTVTFVVGPVGSGTSFVVGDAFTFALNIPSLQVTSWPVSGAYRQLVEIEAQALAFFSTQQAAIANGGFTTLASGSWCDLVALQFYNLLRNAAAVTKGQVTLSDPTGAGPFTITSGNQWFATASGLRYNTTSGGTLPKNGSLVVQVVAEQPGAVYNVANGTITNIVAGVLPGVTVNNPDPGTGSWISSQGSDAETDQALMLRCQQRWPSLGIAPTQSVYSLWATSAESVANHATTITKTLAIPDPAIPGQVDLFLAGPSGAVSGSAVADVVAYILPRIPLGQIALVQSANNAVFTVAGVVNYFAAKVTLSAVTAAVASALSAYIANLGIGSDAGITVKVFYTEILAVVGAASELFVGGPPNIRNVSAFLVNGGSADVGLTLGQVASLTNSLTFLAV